MVGEEPEVDLAPVDSSVIELYSVGVKSRDGVGVIAVEAVPITHPVTQATHHCEVTIEFPHSPKAPTIRSVQEYLNGFAEATVTPEGMAQTVREDLSEALEVDDVAVSVGYGFSGVGKEINIGRPV